MTCNQKVRPYSNLNTTLIYKITRMSGLILQSSKYSRKHGGFSHVCWRHADISPPTAILNVWQHSLPSLTFASLFNEICLFVFLPKTSTSKNFRHQKINYFEPLVDCIIRYKARNRRMFHLQVGKLISRRLDRPLYCSSLKFYLGNFLSGTSFL